MFLLYQLSEKNLKHLILLPLCFYFCVHALSTTLKFVVQSELLIRLLCMKYCRNGELGQQYLLCVNTCLLVSQFGCCENMPTESLQGSVASGTPKMKEKHLQMRLNKSLVRNGPLGSLFFQVLLLTWMGGCAAIYPIRLQDGL